MYQSTMPILVQRYEAATTAANTALRSEPIPEMIDSNFVTEIRFLPKATRAVPSEHGLRYDPF